MPLPPILRRLIGPAIPKEIIRPRPVLNLPTTTLVPGGVPTVHPGGPIVRPPPPAGGPFPGPRPWNPADESEPIHVSAQVVLQPGATQAPNAIALQNPNGSPMVIYEIAVTLVAGDPTNDRVTGAAVGLKLDLGNFPITKDFTPLTALGPARNMLSESPNGSPGIGGAYESYLWRLPCPIWVPAGAVLMPQFQHRNLTNDQITVTIGYSGRSLAPGSKPRSKITLPYVASWVSKGFSLTDAGTDASTETDLVNILNTPIRVQQLIGRVNSAITATSTSSSILPADVPYELMGIRVDGSRGQRIVPVYTPFAQVFSMQDAMFPADFDLEPGGFLRVLINKLASQRSFPAGTSTAWNTQLITSMIGYREVGV